MSLADAYIVGGSHLITAVYIHLQEHNLRILVTEPLKNGRNVLAWAAPKTWVEIDWVERWRISFG